MKLFQRVYTKITECFRPKRNSTIDIFASDVAVLKRDTCFFCSSPKRETHTICTQCCKKTTCSCGRYKEYNSFYCFECSKRCNFCGGTKPLHHKICDACFEGTFCALCKQDTKDKNNLLCRPCLEKDNYGIYKGVFPLYSWTRVSLQ